MTGTDIITAILLAGIFIAIVVYLLYWLYRLSSKDVAFVRTGFGGERVVINGGALVLPIIHTITPVGMRTLRLEVKRAGERSLITKNRMRVEVTAEFYTCASSPMRHPCLLPRRRWASGPWIPSS